MLLKSGAIVFRQKWQARKNRIATEQEWSQITARAPANDTKYEVVLHFGDSPVNLYQARQWYGPMAELDKRHRVVIIARKMATAVVLKKEAPVDVVLAPNIADVEVFMRDQDIKVIYYVNQFTKNMAVMRFSDSLHVFVSHGESDKTYMATGQHRAFDFTLIAGQAAADRLSRTIMNYDVSERTLMIGRPQLDVPTTPPADLKRDHRKIVLYAPTWEGDRPSMAYGSMDSHGRQILRSLMADPKYRVIVRAHPRNGLFSEKYAEATRDAERMIAEANAANPAAGHMWDTTPSMDWQFDVADACITDVSAVAIDWLPQKRPLIVTQPKSKHAEVSSGLLSDLSLLKDSQAPRTAQVLDDLLTDENHVQTLKPWAEYYFGDTSPGAQMSRWLEACDTLIERREKMAAALHG